MLQAKKTHRNEAQESSGGQVISTHCQIHQRKNTGSSVTLKYHDITAAFHAARHEHGQGEPVTYPRQQAETQHTTPRCLLASLDTPIYQTQPHGFGWYSGNWKYPTETLANMERKCRRNTPEARVISWYPK